MKTLYDIAKDAKEHGIDNIDLGKAIDLGNAVGAIIASRKGSYFEADRYERGMSRKFTHAEWDVAHEIADDYEKRGQ